MTEPTGSEMNAPEKGAGKSSKHGAMWAHTATFHIAQGLQEGHPLNPDFEKMTKRGNKEMSSNSKRDLYLKIRVSREELDAIDRKFKNSGMSSRSDFVRAMIFEGYIVHINENEIREIHKLASNIANNINQITVRFHDTGNIYAEDIAEIKDSVDRLWQPLIFLQTKIAKLKH